MANINNINVNGTAYNIVDDEAMRLASNPTNQNILVTNASGQAVDSGVSISEVGSGGTTIYDDSTAYDELTFETIASGVDTVKVGIDMDLLWTNSSPTSSFRAQTVSLDLADYKLVFVVFDMYNVNILNATSVLAPINLSQTFQAVISRGATDIITGSLYTYQRNFTVDSSGVNFLSGYQANGVSAWTSNDVIMIPYQIYGIR